MSLIVHDTSAFLLTRPLGCTRQNLACPATGLIVTGRAGLAIDGGCKTGLIGTLRRRLRVDFRVQGAELITEFVVG